MIDDFKIVDLTLYIESINTLVVGDLHLGYEEEANRRGGPDNITVWLIRCVKDRL